jgi:hypothetical protein
MPIFELSPQPPFYVRSTLPDSIRLSFVKMIIDQITLSFRLSQEKHDAFVQSGEQEYEVVVAIF